MEFDFADLFSGSRGPKLSLSNRLSIRLYYISNPQERAHITVLRDCGFSAAQSFPRRFNANVDVELVTMLEVSLYIPGLRGDGSNQVVMLA